MQKIIDISEHNGDVDFKRIKAAGWHIILRIGWFGNQNYAFDKKFTRNVNGCINNKIPFGIYVYSYAKSADRGREMADWVHKNIANLHCAYGIYIDLEEPGTERYACEVNNAFYQRMKQLRYSNIGLYASLSWIQNYLTKAKYDRLWLAQWSSKRSIACDIWQYSSNGSVAGVGRCDVNECYFAANSPSAIVDKTDKPKTLTVDGLWGKETTKALQRYYGTPVDGIVSNQYVGYKAKNPGLLSSSWNWVNTSHTNGSVVIKALQKTLKVTQDGLFGPKTCKALQKRLGTYQDGYISNPSACVKALQKALNKGKI